MPTTDLRSVVRRNRAAQQYEFVLVVLAGVFERLDRAAGSIGRRTPAPTGTGGHPVMEREAVRDAHVAVRDAVRSGALRNGSRMPGKVRDGWCV